MRIENEFLKVDVTLEGGNLTSIYDKKNHEELLYQKDERSWMGQDVVIFPVVARLKDGSYHVDGKEYFLKNHGVIRYSKLSVVTYKDDEIILGLKYNEDTLKIYPYKFYFEVCYRLIGNQLTVEYHVTNEDDRDIYFYVGGHPALIVNGYEDEKGYIYKDVSLIFDNEYKVSKYVLNEDGSYIREVVIDTIPKNYVMSKEIINDAKTIIYDIKDIKEVTLVSNNKKFIFDVCKAPILAIWTKEGFGNYLCVEPWWGIPDFENPNLELKDKPFINSLGVKEKFITDYKIRFEA